jgi:hypothetical protein
MIKVKRIEGLFEEYGEVTSAKRSLLTSTPEKAKDIWFR